MSRVLWMARLIEPGTMYFRLSSGLCSFRDLGPPPYKHDEGCLLADICGPQYWRRCAVVCSDEWQPIDLHGSRCWRAFPRALVELDKAFGLVFFHAVRWLALKCSPLCVCLKNHSL